MPRFWAGLALSSVIHGTLALLFAQIDPDAPRQRQPLLIDFTVDSAPGPPPRAGVPPPTSTSEPVRARRVRTHQERRDPLVPHLDEPTPAAPLVQAETEDAESQSPSEGSEDGGVVERSGEGSGEAKAGVAEAVEGGTGGVEAATAEYNRAHFEYLRREIHQRLIYPEVAREMGWEGRVLLSFVVAEDGSVREIARHRELRHRPLGHERRHHGFIARRRFHGPRVTCEW